MSVSTTNVTSEPEIALDRLLDMYRRMTAIRLFEERVNDLYTRALMPGLAHLYIGEEAVAVGVCTALERTDYITSTHRGHGHCWPRGRPADVLSCSKGGRLPRAGGSFTSPIRRRVILAQCDCKGAGIATGALRRITRAATRQRVLLRRRRPGKEFYEEMNRQLWKLPVIRLQTIRANAALLGNDGRRDRRRPAAFGIATAQSTAGCAGLSAPAAEAVAPARQGLRPTFASVIHIDTTVTTSAT